MCKLKLVLEQCSHMRSELHSIKSLTFHARRKMDLNVKSVRDMIKNSSKPRPARQPLPLEDKENDPCGLNRLGQIQVELPGKGEAVEYDTKLNEKIRLQLQEIRLIEQRENLIRKKNERLNNYYSENKKQLEMKRSQVLEHTE